MRRSRLVCNCTRVNSCKEAGAGGGRTLPGLDWVGSTPVTLTFLLFSESQGLVYPIWFNPGSIRSKCQLFSGRGKKSRELMFPNTACDGIITSAYYKATIQVSLTLGGGQGWGYPICQILACTSTS